MSALGMFPPDHPPSPSVSLSEPAAVLIQAEQTEINLWLTTRTLREPHTEEITKQPLDRSQTCLLNLLLNKPFPIPTLSLD